MLYDADTTIVADLTDDIIDTRDLAELLEELEALYEAREEWEQDEGRDEDDEDDEPNPLDDYQTELLAMLRSIRDGMESAWEDESLISEHYFTDYMRELLEDCGYIPKDFPTWIEVDWEATAKNVKADYSTVEINGTDYYFRYC